MDERAQGIVLRVHPLTETSLIIRWLTPELGRIATVAKGARRPKSPFHGKLDLFYRADFTFGRSRRSDLHALREVNLLEAHTFLRRELGRLQQASYCAALIEQVTELETPLPAIFKLMQGMLEHLAGQAPEPKSIFGFELKLLDELGLEPDLTASHLTGGTREIVKILTKTDWSAIRLVKPSLGQLTELQQFLHGFLIFHLGKFPRNRAAALGLREDGVQH